MSDDVPTGDDDSPPPYTVEILIDCHGPCQRKNLPPSEFHKRNNARGYQYECKSCRSAADKAYKAKKRLQRTPESRAEARQTIADKEQQEEQPAKKKKSGASNKHKHRNQLLENAGLKIAEGLPIADTSRSVHFLLSLIVERQLKMFCGAQAKTITNKIKIAQLLDVSLFSIKREISRACHRAREVAREEEKHNGSLLELILADRKRALAILNLDSGATQEEIKLAYKKQALDAHPDREGGSVEKMQKLNAAFEILMERTSG